MIKSHEAAVALHIRTQNGSELTLNFLCGHGVISLKVYEGDERYDCSGNIGYEVAFEPPQR